MSSIREQILLALMANTAGTVQLDSRIYRSRQEAFSRAAFPALVVETASNEPAPYAAGTRTMTHALDVRFLLLVDAPIPDAAADPILVDLHSRLMADPILGGLAMNIEPGPTTYAFAEDGVAVVETHYLVKYRTLVQSLTSA